MDFVTIGDYTSVFSTCQKWLSDRKVALSTVAVSYVSSEETWKLGRFFWEREIEIDRVVDNFIYESNNTDTIFIRDNDIPKNLIFTN